jgi:plastocyanin
LFKVTPTGGALSAAYPPFVLRERNRGARTTHRLTGVQMPHTRFALLGSLACTLAFATPSTAQGVSVPAPGHTIVVNLIEQPGPKPFAFQPAQFSAHTGDTLRFVQASATMHNVHFKSLPKGAKLGSAATSQYLTAKGQSYTVVIDSRFVDGTYEIVCDPHELIGMHGFLTVSSAAGGHH